MEKVESKNASVIMPKIQTKPQPKIDIRKPFYDQSTYWGRLRHFLDVIDPRTLFTSDTQLKKSVDLVEHYKQTSTLPPNTTVEELWQAKKITSSVLHPDTGHKIFWAQRMSAFVPMNVPLVVGMTASRTAWGQMFWQWANQSYNVAVTYGNRNASSSMSLTQIGLSYATAVAISCGLALGMAKLIKPTSGRLMRCIVPYTAVAGAGSVNIVLMRLNELKGIYVKDADGNPVGLSAIAGRKALALSTFTRAIFLPIPVLVLPGMIMSVLDKVKFLQVNPRARFITECAVVTASLWGALPAAIGLFPQDCAIKPSQLEPKFHNLKDKNGKPFETLYFNKGL
eukprot:TRINITY_DN517_c0_g1_i1.p1 TRINITY_DN517_c0_g1~~TRINITY_DN517_c0_g1_i1.p1  ORF type:complete len:339 (+),score=61.49 TRINITY_DN517_c0_g1_i1:57-1073(+)